MIRKLFFNFFFLALSSFLVFTTVSSCKQPKIDPAFIIEIEEHRKEYINSFVMTDQSPLTENEIEFLEFFSPDPGFAFQAKYMQTPDERPFEMPTYSGKKKNFKKHGELHFSYKKSEFQLSAYKNLQYIHLPMYKDVLFVPFKDLTNDETSYGGGRYLDLKISDIENGNISLDFNKSYNPWCAYSDGFNCPIPPLENHLEIEIKAGEKNYQGPRLQRRI